MLKAHLLSEEKTQLEQFRLHFEREPQERLWIESADLLDKNNLTTYLEYVTECIHAPNIMVTASLFSKRYSYLLLVPVLYSMSRFNKFFNVAIGNIKIIDGFENDLWLPKLYVKDQTMLMPTNDKERMEWRSLYYKQIFGQHLTKVWDLLSSVGKVPKQTLWENTAIYIFWLFETVLHETSTERTKEDFHFLLFEADGTFFGNNIKNPLTCFYNNKVFKNGLEIRPRQTCCFFYQISEKSMCKTCPKKCLPQDK